jgi:hypothetical protein
MVKVGEASNMEESLHQQEKDENSLKPNLIG